MVTNLDAATVAAIRAAAPNVHNGTYTVSHPTQGHFTIKLWTGQKGDFTGKRILSLLTGPNNETDFKGVAFWNDERKIAHVWRRFKGARSSFPIDGYHWQKDGGWSAYEQKLAIWCCLAVRGSSSYWRAEGYSLLLESRCCICNRKLTHPESIEAGIGPECARRS